MESIRSKIGLQFIVSNGSIAAHFCLSIVLARLLTPSEIGIFSITAVFVGFTQVFRDFGVVSFIKRQKSLTPELLRSATGVLFTSSWIIAGLLYLSTDLWANFFKQPGIHEIMPVLALGFVFIPFGSIPQAVLAREMDVRKTTVVTGISTLVYISTCITLASMGFSYMSMAWSNLASIVVSGVTLSLMMPRELRVGPSFRGWGRVVQFGAGAMLTSSLKAVDTALPDTLLGKLSGPYDVGIFSRANSTVNILNTVTGPTVNYFALPYLAKVHHGGRKLNDELARTVAYLTAIMWPALVVTGVMANDIILFLYGAAWRESAAVIPWLCLASGIQVTFAIMQPAMTAMGRPYVSAVPLALTLSAKLLAALFFFDGTLVSYARAVAIAECVSIPAYLWLSRRYIGMKVSDWVKSLRASVGVTVVILLQIMVCDRIFDVVISPFWSLVIAAIWLIPGWTLTILYLKHPLSLELKKAAGQLWRRGIEPDQGAVQATGSRVVVYGAVACAPPPPPALRQFRDTVKHAVRMQYDLLKWRSGSLAKLNYRSYLTPWVVNRGDEAIVQASCQTMGKFRDDLVFVRANWEDRRGFGSRPGAQAPDLIAVCGSGYIAFDRAGVMAKRISEDLRAMDATSVPVVLYGIGVNRLLNAEGGNAPPVSPEDESTLRRLLERATAISVRDKGSLQELSRYTTKPVRLVGDPAFFLCEAKPSPPFSINRRAPGKPLVGVNFPFHGPDATNRIRKDLPAYIDMLKQIQQLTQCNFNYMMHFEAEQVVVKMIAARGVQMDVISGDPDTLCRGYANLNVHLGGMLHSCILASSAGTPSVALAYDIKHFGFFELLGLEDYCLSAVPFDGDKVIAAVQRALANEAALRAVIHATRSRMEKEADAFVADCLASMNHGGEHAA